MRFLLSMFTPTRAQTTYRVTELTELNDEQVDQVAGAKRTGGVIVQHQTSHFVSTPSGNFNSHFSQNSHFSGL
jgi:hypothetical protein